MRKSMKKSETAITTIIGKDSVVEGDFRSGGSVRLDGTVEGNVTVEGNLIIGATGKIHG
ncbi:MAG: polymer-forming cytoskeletal protein, partial [Lachnospiraceae bacterium]|nr:polymer-forming cytoskeletal protein [Lachnospiraceae bacterium]